MQTTQQFCERNFPHNIGIEPSELNQVQMVRVFVTITQQLTLAQVTRKFCTQKGFSDDLAVKHENFTGTVCIFVNGGGGGGKQLAKFSYGFILSPQIDFEYFVSHHHVLKLVYRSSRINDKFSKYVI